jgi:hypothetical protein
LERYWAPAPSRRARRANRGDKRSTIVKKAEVWTDVATSSRLDDDG